MEYEWRLLHEDLDESDDDMDEKLQVCGSLQNVESFMMSILQRGVGPGLTFRAESCCGKGNRVYFLLPLISVVLGFYPSHNCPCLPAPTNVTLQDISYVIMAAAHLLIQRIDTRGPLILMDVGGSSVTENDVMKSHVSPRSGFCVHRVDL